MFTDLYNFRFFLGVYGDAESTFNTNNVIRKFYIHTFLVHKTTHAP